LYMDEKAAETLFVVYKRYIDELTIDKLSANNNMEIIEPAYIDPSRQYNAWAVGLLCLTALIAAMAEFYVVRPPNRRRLSRLDERAD
jgi:tyrosine-protein kinase Etk/Wzc